jgi:hypothetical protein
MKTGMSRMRKTVIWVAKVTGPTLRGNGGAANAAKPWLLGSRLGGDRGMVVMDFIIKVDCLVVLTENS